MRHPDGVLRERGVQHRNLEAKSITELELFDSFPGLCTDAEIERLQAAGYVSASRTVTALGRERLEQLRGEARGAR
jgi:hypothetical protein